MSTNSFTKNKEILEKFFQNRIIFNNYTVSEGTCCFKSINMYKYTLFNIDNIIIDNIVNIFKYFDSLGKCEGKYFHLLQVSGKESESNENVDILNMKKSQINYFNHDLVGVGPFYVVITGIYKKFSNKKIKSDECVICLSNPPNVLFCHCGHICVCNECENISETESGKVKCPLCRQVNRIIRII